MLIARVDIDVLHALYGPAVKKVYKEFLNKDRWAPEDFLALPSVLPHLPGIYGDLLTGDLEDKSVEIELYTRSTLRTLPMRTEEHRRIAAQDLDYIKQRHPGSVYYPEAHRPNVNHNFRELATFRTAPPDRYLKLLEALFTLWFLSMRKPTYESTFGTLAAWALMMSVRSKLHLPPIEWRGLNMACPFNQGFFDNFARVAVPCVHCREAAEPGARSFADSGHLDPPSGRFVMVTGSVMGYFLMTTQLRKG
jgi:hypothetical protein